jgi:hypothetical protein
MWRIPIVSRRWGGGEGDSLNGDVFLELGFEFLAVCYGGGEFYGQHGSGRDGRGTFLEVLPLLLGCFEGGHGRDDRVGRKSIGIHFSRREILVNVNTYRTFTNSNCGPLRPL